MDNLAELDEGEEAQNFYCPECSSEVTILEVLDESFDYECTQCNRKGTHFL